MTGRNPKWRTLTRQLVSWSLLGIMLVSIAGLPVPPRKQLADGMPFPCQDRPCGCATAAACWRHCCCFDDAEKLQWAAAHGVTPPEFVVRAARLASASAKPKHPSCCKADATPRPAKKVRGPRVVLLDSYQHCQGLSSAFKTLIERWLPTPLPRLGVAPWRLGSIALVDQHPVVRPRAPEPPVP